MGGIRQLPAEGSVKGGRVECSGIRSQPFLIFIPAAGNTSRKSHLL